jgi:hypothetical protein
MILVQMNPMVMIFLKMDLSEDARIQTNFR